MANKVDTKTRLELQLRKIFDDEMVDEGKFNFKELEEKSITIKSVFSAIKREKQDILLNFGFQPGHAIDLVAFRVDLDDLDDWKDVLNEKENRYIIKVFDLKEKAVTKKQSASKINNAVEDIKLSTAFKQTFQGEDSFAGHVKKRLYEYIVKCAELWSAGNRLQVHAPICVITQSSGYGKSRLCYEIASRLVTTYICLRGPHQSGFPPRSTLADYFASTQLDDLNKATSIIIYIIRDALTRVKEILETKGKKLSHKLLKEVASEYRTNQEWLERKSFSSSHLGAPLDQSIDIKQLLNDFKAIMAKYPLIIVIDEAHFLFETYGNNRSPFQLIRKALREYFEGFQIAIVLVSTNCCIGKYELSPYKYSSSLRDPNTNAMIPFTRLTSTDCMASEYFAELDKVYSNNLDNKTPESKNPLLYQWVLTRNPLETFFRLGRPLWASYPSGSNICQIAELKLLHPDTTRDKHNQVSSPVEFGRFLSNTLAVLGARIDFLIRFINPSYGTACELIDKCMGTLVDLNQDLGQVTLRYVSEPILAHAAASYMSNENILKVVLEKFIQYIDRNNTWLSTGEIGELAAQLILLIANDKARVQDVNMDLDDDELQNKDALEESEEVVDDESDQESDHEMELSTDEEVESSEALDESDEQIRAKPLTVKTFLIALLGSDNYQKVSSWIPDGVQEGLVCFNHFIKKVDDLSMQDVFYDFIGRNAAGSFRDCFPGIDLFVPVILKDNTITMLYFQIKNVMDFLDITKVLKKADPKQVECLKDHPNYNAAKAVVFIMDLVETEDKVIKKQDRKERAPNAQKDQIEKIGSDFCCLIIHGTSPYKCLDANIGKLIKQLIDLPREPLLKYSRYAQKGCFNGAMSYSSRAKIDLS